MAELQNPDPLVEAVAKARAESSRRPDRSTTGGLNSTLNGKHFYVNSGLVSVNNNETAVLDIPNIGERDILFCINPFIALNTSDNITMKVKNNDVVIYETVYDASYFHTYGNSLHFIIPASTNIEITFTNSDASSHNVGVSAYGDYL